jgi:O-antigen/teichoic acid export membrane protein
MTTAVRAASRTFVGASPAANSRVRGLGWVLASEAGASVLGSLALVHQARRLGPGSFARVEYAAAVAAWLLVVVRGGFDVIVYREAARRPRLVAPLTDVLLGLRAIAACVSFGVVLILASLVGPDRGAVVAVSGLLLFASIWVVDVGPRAEGRLGSVALAQVIRALGLTGSVVLLVRGPGHALRASGCLVGAEMLGAAVALAVHSRRYGPLRPRWRRRTSLTLARLGMVAGLTRFGRVTVFGLDMLALGWWAGGGLGPYAAARRVVFALLAMGVVVPAMIGPSIARAWSFGLDEARARVGSAMDGLWALALPAALGLVLTSDRAMPWLFGPGYEDGGPWLALAAARLPWLLSGTFAQTVLVSCRREAWCLRLVAGQTALALLVVPSSAFWAGPWGVGWAILGVEIAGSIGGWVLLARLGLARRLGLPPIGTVGGCLALAAACHASKQAPFLVTCLSGALAYGVVSVLVGRPRNSRDLATGAPS